MAKEADVAIKNKSISFANMDAEVPYINPYTIDSKVEAVEKDLKKIIKEMETLSKVWQDFSNHPKTTGTWDDMAKAIKKSVGKYKSNFNTVVNKLDRCIAASSVEYVQTYVKGTQNASATANSINTNA